MYFEISLEIKYGNITRLSLFYFVSNSYIIFITQKLDATAKNRLHF